MFLAAVVQINSRMDIDANWKTAQDLIRRAAGRGATSWPRRRTRTSWARPPRRSVLAKVCKERPARALPSWPGSWAFTFCWDRLTRKAIGPTVFTTPASCSARRAKQLAVYRKIHLFDADVADGAVHRESHSVQPGKEVVVAETPLARLGLSICYDLRFGELYRQLGERGAEVLCIPAAFLTTTGRAHWEVLLRARAIENQCYVLAPGQWGRYDDQGTKESYGHSMIVDPWGQVLAMAADGPGIAVAEIDLTRVAQVRGTIPMRKPGK